jgi:hypothetical protein
MEGEMSDRFTVKVVFRGLFLALAGKDELKVLLPQASDPAERVKREKNKVRKALFKRLQPLREHHAAIELSWGDLDPSSPAKDELLRVDKPSKGEVGLYLLAKQSVEIRGRAQARGSLPENLKAASESYQPFGSGRMLARHGEHGFDQLPVFEPALSANAPNNCAATYSTDFGEVYTERRSKKGEEVRLWEERSAVRYLSAWERIKLGLIKSAEDKEPRPINLDLVVRFTLPANDVLEVACRPIGATAPIKYFYLRPVVAGGEVKVWVKNRELESILRDVDDPDASDAVMTVRDATDWDHAMFMLLAADSAQHRVPRVTNTEVSDSGSGCGGAGQPGG